MSYFGSAETCEPSKIVKIDAPGVSRSLYPLFTLPHLSCGVEDVLPLCEVPLHQHDVEEVIFCYAGQGVAMIGQEERYELLFKALYSTEFSFLV